MALFFILPFSAVLFFFGRLFGGIDNMLVVQSTLGFLFFFTLGYQLDAKRVLHAAGRVPVVLSACFLRVMVCLGNCWALARTSSDTMPLYLAHGYVAHALCSIIAMTPVRTGRARSTTSASRHRNGGERPMSSLEPWLRTEFQSACAPSI